MSLDILVTSISNPRARPVLARRLAQSPEISLEKAQSLLNNLPVRYQSALSHKEAQEEALRLRKLGVTCRIVESSEVPHAPPPREVETAWPARPSPPPVSPPVSRPREHAAVYGLPREETGGRRSGRGMGKVIAALLLVALIIAAAAYFGTFGGYSIRRTGPLASPGTRSSGNEDRADRPVDNPSPADRTPRPHRRRSDRYADSARAAHTPAQAVAFYKIAISFNRRNIDAWYGLIGAYRDAGMPDSASAARAEMQTVFGDDVSSIAGIVGRFGRVLEIARDEQQTLRIRYARAGGKRGEERLTEEVYRLMKALRTECRCEALSVHVRAGRGEELLGYLPLQPFPPSLRAFRKKAALTYLR